MFIFSIKLTKAKIVMAVAVCVCLLAGVIHFSKVDVQPTIANSSVSLTAQNSSERIAFLNQFGWQVKEDPVEVVEVIIPADFNEIYTSYNNLQLEQGFDLSMYAGQRVKRWTYEVINYPEYIESGLINANIMVLDGKVIGGDVCCIKLDGFMHGFKMQSTPQNITDTTTTEPTTENVTTTESQDDKII